MLFYRLQRVPRSQMDSETQIRAAACTDWKSGFPRREIIIFLCGTARVSSFRVWRAVFQAGWRALSLTCLNPRTCCQKIPLRTFLLTSVFHGSAATVLRVWAETTVPIACKNLKNFDGVRITVQSNESDAMCAWNSTFYYLVNRVSS